jgi:hypothetical protein
MRTNLEEKNSLSEVPIKVGGFMKESHLFLWTASEPRRFDLHGPLELFLNGLLKDKNLTIREACKIAGCSPSVLHGWLQGAYPTGTVIHLKKLCNHYGYTLSEALTGAPDDL